MNELLASWDLGSWKSIFTALLLPPTPFAVLILIGARQLWQRRGVGWLWILLSVFGLWLTTSAGVGQALEALWLKPPPVLGPTQREALAQRAGKHGVAIVVLGSGREAYAPEYGTANLNQWSAERLRYGLWLGRETGVPVAFSGGVGWSQTDGLPEAQIAARIATADFHQPLRWTEETSRDTRENAVRTVALLAPAGITEIVLVTHGWHMRRAIRAFEQAGEGRVKLVAAPMGRAVKTDQPALLWLPTAEGAVLMRQVLRESLGLMLGG